jgi:hypothetical protein
MRTCLPIGERRARSSRQPSFRGRKMFIAAIKRWTIPAATTRGTRFMGGSFPGAPPRPRGKVGRTAIAGED